MGYNNSTRISATFLMKAAAWTLGMIVVQLSLVGELDDYGLLSTNNTSVSGAERSFGPSIWQKVVEVLGCHIKPSRTTPQAT